MSTDFRPAGLTVYPKVEDVISAASLKGATTSGGVDATESLNIEAVSWLGLADLFIDADTNGEGVDFHAVKA